MFFPNINLYLGAAVVAASVGAWFLWSNTRNDLDAMIAQNARLEAIIQKHEEINTENARAILDLEASFNNVAEDFRELEDEFTISRMEDGLLADKFQGHDLEKLASSKPELIEGIINKASKHSNRCFELLTGAPLNKQEKEAINEADFNPECPWLFHDLKR